MDEESLVKTRGEHLPHWTCEGAIYHVVFRLADSVPRAKFALWAEACGTLDKHARDGRLQRPDGVRHAGGDRHSDQVDAFLDAGHGACHLGKPKFAEFVANALRHFDGERYRLHAWCVMPNHVHVIVEPLGQNPLSRIIHSWKSFTATEINRSVGLSGTLWQADAYNHIIRTQREDDFQVRYVWENSDKAGIRDWPWRGALAFGDSA